MKEYAVGVEFVYYHTFFIEAESKEEAIEKTMSRTDLDEKFRVFAFGNEHSFDSNDFVIADEVTSA